MNPPAFLALWNGVLPGREAEYEAWHSMEHVPERLGAPGFRAVRRYAAEGGSSYFTLYELDGLEALDTPAYMTLVREPTPWSARMRKTLTAFRRLPCRTTAARRFGQGGAVATLRIAAQEPATTGRLCALMEQAVADGLILGFTHGDALGADRPYEAFPEAPLPAAESLLIVEATGANIPAAIMQECRDVAGEHRSELGSWRLLQSLERSDLKDPHLLRQPSRDDLRSRW